MKHVLAFATPLRLAGLVALGLLSSANTCVWHPPNTPGPDPALPTVAFKSDVFFSKTAGSTMHDSLENELISAIDDADESVSVFFAELANTAVADALIRAARRTLTVEVGTNSATSNTPAFHRLRNNGVLVKTGSNYYNGKLLIDQHRYVIIDKRYVWLGGHNLSADDQTGNDNSALFLNLPGLAQCLQIQFENEYGSGHVAFGPISSQTNQALSANYAYLTPRIATHDNIETSMANEIAAARSSVKFLSTEITSPAIATQLGNLVAKGIKVQGVIEKDKSGQTGGQYSALLAKNVDLRLDGNTGIMNHNLVIIDDSTVLLGSFGMLPQSQSSQHLMKIENDASILKAYRGEFERVSGLTQPATQAAP